MHNAASRMLSHATNVDILTTFADIGVADLDNSSASTIKDPLAKIEEVYLTKLGEPEFICYLW